MKLEFIKNGLAALKTLILTFKIIKAKTLYYLKIGLKCVNK